MGLWFAISFSSPSIYDRYDSCSRSNTYGAKLSCKRTGAISFEKSL